MLFLSGDGASRSPPPPFVGSVLLEHLIVAGAATAGESRVIGTGIRRGARNSGEGTQPVLTRGSFGMAALRNGVFVVLSRSLTEPRHITAAGLGIERLGQYRRCDARGRNRSDQGEFWYLRDRKLPGRLRRHRDAGLFVDPNPGEKLVGAVLRTEDGASPFFSSNHADRPKETTSDVMAFRARVITVSPSHECWLRMMPPDK